MPGRITKRAGQRRDRVEETLAILHRCERDLDEIILRNRQANRRTPLVQSVLDPALERLFELRGRIKLAKSIVGDIWIEGQNQRWEIISFEESDHD